MTFGYDGPYTADAHGLVAATLTPGSVADDPGNDIGGALETGLGVTAHDITVPDGTALSRFALFDAETDGAHDLDLYVFDSDGALVGVSGSGTSEEQVDLVLPAGGVYTVVVHGFQTEGGAPANYTLFDWQVPIDDGEGSLTVTASPTTVTNGGSGVVSIAWAGLVRRPALSRRGVPLRSERTGRAHRRRRVGSCLTTSVRERRGRWAIWAHRWLPPLRTRWPPASPLARSCSSRASATSSRSKRWRRAAVAIWRQRASPSCPLVGRRPSGAS